MKTGIEMHAIGTVHNDVLKPADDIWGGLVSRIDLDPALFNEDALVGLEAFSHVEIVFVFDRVEDAAVQMGARHPRNREDWPLTGIFAQRGKNRPNRIGVTVCRLQSVKELSLYVEELDAIDGTPVLDIKPYLREFGPRGESTRQPEWATELMADYWKPRPR